MATTASEPLLERVDGPVLVTGAAGHLGCNLVRRLLAEGVEVRVLLREGSNNLGLDGLPVEQRWGDLRDARAVAAAAAGCRHVFHTAAMVSWTDGDRAHRRALFRSNVLGTRRVLQAARQAGVERVVVTGSLTSTGQNPDDASAPSTERDPFDPFEGRDPYALSKREAEHECLAAAAEGQHVVIATSCAILGPHDYKPSPMGRALLDHSRGKLHAYIPGGIAFVSTRDVVDGHLRALLRGAPGHRYILSSGYLDMEEVLATFEEVSGVPRPRLRLPPRVMSLAAHVSQAVLTALAPSWPQRFTPAAVRHLTSRRRADATKAQQELGFSPSDPRAAIREAYVDFAARGLLPARPWMEQWQPPASAAPARGPAMATAAA